MKRLVALLLFFAVLVPAPAMADPADIDAAARGVVRVLVVGDDGDQIFPISHGTGFAVTPELIVTNAHVISEAQQDNRLSIGIVPSDGGEAIYARLIAVSPRNDLALLSTTTPMHLPPLTIAANLDLDLDSGRVVSVGYPMNVDKAQGLSEGDIFRTQPPVKSTGFLSGRRPSRDFDTILHTAPIARGSSGGPLLDECGRVVGVNSFGAESGGPDAEFFFAVSTRELIPFLRAHNVSPRINGLPCRSLADLDEAERERVQREQAAAAEAARLEEEHLARERDQARREIQFAVMDERDNMFMLALVLLMVAGFGGAFAWLSWEREEDRQMKIALGVVGFALVGALVSWAMRPGLSVVEERVAQRIADLQKPAPDDGPTGVIASPGKTSLVCVIDTSRSRITGAQPEDVPFEWSNDGCVNDRTQYGFANGEWTRVLVPNETAEVAVNHFDPDMKEYRIDRYLLNSDEMVEARKARGAYSAPQCGEENAAATLGNSQRAVLALLPTQPNERLVYNCSARPAESGEETQEQAQ